MNCGPSLKFRVQDIKDQQGLIASMSLDAAALLGEAIEEAKIKEPITVALEFSVGGKEILLEARLAGRFTLPCSLCLAEHRRPFEANFEETYDASADEIDAKEDLRQAVIMEIPQRSVCREDCKGLCGQCGTNRNEKPCGCVERRPSPFDALKKLT